jgi:uncharacterized protein YggE
MKTLILTAALTTATAASAQQAIAPMYPLARGETLVQVTATGKAMRPADKIELACPISASGKTAEVARANLAKKRDELAKALSGFGVADTSVRLIPAWHASGGLLGGLSAIAATAAADIDDEGVTEANDDGEGKRKAATGTVRVRLPGIDKIDGATDALTDQGCGAGIEPQIGLTDNAAALQEAKSLAFAKAAADAGAIAEKLGMKIIRPIRITDSPASMMDMLGPEYKAMISKMSSALGGQMIDNPGQVSTDATVMVEYLLGPR